MLNSQSVNAFALPTGQLYVTRGLIALANDESELASVLAHEMGHVIARHAEIREEEARSRPRSRVFTDRGQRSGSRRAGACQIETRAGELLAGAGIRSRRHRHRHRGARRLRSLRRGAIPTVAGAQFRTQAAEQTRRHQSRRARLPLFASGDAASASPMRWPMPASTRLPPRTARQRLRKPRTPTSPISTASYIGEDPSEGFVRGRRFLHPKLGFTFTAPDGFALDNTAQAVLGVKHGGGAGAAARRRAGAGRADACADI